MDQFRHMTDADNARLATHPGSERLFRKLLTGSPDGQALLVAALSKAEWLHLRTLLELSFVNVEDARVVILFTVSSLVRLAYLAPSQS